ncbi:MAG: glucose-6-phosphate isomerase [Firmicutes bacterium]|nr:glucose-6-phosphate isomerase [Bacillota bacterium]
MDTQNLRITLDFNNMMTDYVGPNGITEDDIKGSEKALEKAYSGMEEKRASGKMDWRDLPYNQDDVVDDILNYVDSVKDDTDAFVVLGIGGSALGPLAVQQAINHPFYNELPREKRGNYPRLYVADNIDPERLPYLFDIIDLKKTIFNCVSKSGSTSETMSQFLIIKTLIEEKLGKAEAAKHIVCTTDKEKGNLIGIAKEEGYKTFIIPSGVGGRFSELTPVGLLPAAMCGIDIKEMLKGAAFMDELSKVKDVYKNPAYMFALLHMIGMKKGKNISVMLPYADSLKYISDWYAQLWAESLGKKYDNYGNIVNYGQTPVKSLGVTDQHSQIQLYAEGPSDKIIVFIAVDKFKKETAIPKIYGDIPSLGFLGGATQNKLIETERIATEYALQKAEKTNMTITLPEVNEFTLGELLYFFEVATGFAGELLEIDAFDQPGVEEGKNATYAMFGRPGYDEKRKELESRPAKNNAYII